MDKMKSLILLLVYLLFLIPNLCRACFVIGFVSYNNPSLFAIIVFVGVWIIEAIGARKKIGRDPQKILLAIFVANIVTTLLGVLISLITNIDFITALIASFFLTILIEAVVLRFFFGEEDWANLLSISFTINTESYLFLFIIMVTEAFSIGGMIAILIIIPSFLFQSFNFLSAGKDIPQEKKRFYKAILVILSIALIALSFRGAIKGSTLFGDLSGRSTGRSRARDAVRQSDIRQLFTAQEMYYEQNGIYFTAPGREGIPEIPNFFPAFIEDPRTPNKHYIWLDNTDDNQKFCAYTELEYEKAYFAASHKGAEKISSVPTIIDCW